MKTNLHWSCRTRESSYKYTPHCLVKQEKTTRKTTIYSAINNTKKPPWNSSRNSRRRWRFRIVGPLYIQSETMEATGVRTPETRRLQVHHKSKWTTTIAAKISINTAVTERKSQISSSITTTIVSSTFTMPKYITNLLQSDHWVYNSHQKK